MKTLDSLARLLLVVGGLNWGLIGVSKMDFVAGLFGAGTMLTNLVYTLMGLAAVYYLIQLTMSKKGRK